jgi:regulator of cell morphogenesis and NO signaling
MNTKLTADMTVKDIVVQYPQTRATLESLGIDYCCGGKVPLGQAIEQAGLSIDAVFSDLDQALAAVNTESASIHDWNSEPLTELANHIENTHHVFMKEQLPRLAILLDKTIQAHGQNHGAMLSQLKQSFVSLKTDIEMHLAKEEQILFPLIRQMDAFIQGQGPTPNMHCGTIGNPIRQMEHEHDVAGDFLAQMRQITGNYSLPQDACLTFVALFEGLNALEKDLHEHIHLENNILFPKAQDLETKVN